MDKVEKRIRRVLRILETMPGTHNSEIARMCEISVQTTQKDVAELRGRARRNKNVKILERHEIALGRKKDEKWAEERESRGESTQYDLLELIRREENIGKPRKIFVDPLKVKISMVKTFFDKLVRAAKDMSYSRGAAIKNSLIKYARSLKNKPIWLEELEKI
jgi:hypothetical protein